ISAFSPSFHYLNALSPSTAVHLVADPFSALFSSRRVRETLAMAYEKPVVGSLQVGAKPAKTKKAKTTTEPKAKKPAAHPPYAEMIKEAITVLKERSGSSLYAIGKFIEDKHRAHLPSNFRKIVLLQLKRLAAAGKLTKVKGSYKLSSASAPVKTRPVVSPKKPVIAPAKPKAKSKPAVVAKPKAKTAAVRPKVAAKRKSPAKPNPKSAARPPKAAAKHAPGRVAVGLTRSGNAKAPKAANSAVKKPTAKKAKK
ncbi:hypothetical protein BHM03_00036878, partial [Ensete ventricosum]